MNGKPHYLCHCEEPNFSDDRVAYPQGKQSLYNMPYAEKD